MMKETEPLSKTISIGGREFEFEQKVDVVIEMEDRSIVLLNTDDFEYGDPLVGRNILCYSHEGELLWRVEDTEMTIGKNNTPQSFLALYVGEDDEIRAGNPDASFIINPVDGTFLDSEWKFR